MNGMLLRVRNLAFDLAFYGGSVPIVLLALLALPLGARPLRVMCDAWSRWHHWCCVRLLGIRLRETGTRPAKPVLYAIKHESFYEAIALPVLFDYPAALTKQELFALPGWGRAARVYGLIEVRRTDGPRALRAMVRDVRPALAAGRPIVIFPEGTRVPHGTAPALQSGFAGLYKIIGLPVVPVAVDSGLLYHRRWKRPGVITVHFGPEIAPGLPREEIEALVRQGINALNQSQAPDPMAGAITETAGRGGTGGCNQ